MWWGGTGERFAFGRGSWFRARGWSGLDVLLCCVLLCFETAVHLQVMCMTWLVVGTLRQSIIPCACGAVSILVVSIAKTRSEVLHREADWLSLC